MVNCSNTPVEVIDMEYPYLLPIEYSRRENSAGGGRYRGGMGQVRAYEILQGGVTFAMFADRMRIAPEMEVERHLGRQLSVESDRLDGLVTQ